MGNEKGLTGGAKGGVLRMSIPGDWTLAVTAVTRMSHGHLIDADFEETKVCIEIEKEGATGRAVAMIYLDPDKAEAFLGQLNESITVARGVIADVRTERTALIETLRTTMLALELVLASPPETDFEEQAARAVVATAAELLGKVGAL